MILGGIDIGTNSLRLLVADADPPAFRVLHTDRITTRLGQGLDASGMLSPEARQRSLATLLDFAHQVRRSGARAVAVVGTSALRNASNAAAFAQEAEDRTGLAIRIIGGDEEARLTLLGVRQALQAKGIVLDSALVIDIGGGSTEVIVLREEGLLLSSLPLGAVYLTERFIRHDPPTVREMNGLRETVAAELSQIDQRMPGQDPSRGRPDVFVGTAGTVTTLASMDQRLQQYDPDRINGYILTRGAISAIVERLCTTTLAQRKGLPGLERGREDIILAGAVITREIMDRYGYERMIVSDGGLREGIVLDLYERIKN